MDRDIGIIDWWYNSLKLTSADKDMFKNAFRKEGPSTEGDFDKLEQRFFNLLPNGNIQTDQCLSFDVSASAIIEKLFNKYVDDDTLLITSHSEHPSVVKNIVKCKNVIYVGGNGFLAPLSTFSEEICKYKKAFVYIIGTSNGDKQVVPQYFYSSLRKILDGYNIEYKLVIDACQELFLTPRDYSMFDYVIGTAHALVSKYDTGIVISKEKPFTDKIYNWGNTFITYLEHVLKRKEQLYSFSMVLSMYYADIIRSEKFRVINHIPYLFSIEDPLKSKSDYKTDTDLSIFRGSFAITDFEHLYNSIEKTDFAFSNYF